MAQPKVGTYDDADAAALRRMHFPAGGWYQLNWYVTFSKLEFDKLSEGELVNMQDEIVALLRTVYPNTYGSISRPSIHESRQFQETVGRHLNQLADEGSVRFGPFTLSIDIVHRNHRPQHVNRISKILGIAEQGQSSWFPRSDATLSLDRWKWQEHLLYYLARLLSTVAGIRRCPQCRQIYLQFRTTASYCGRDCQIAAYVQRRSERRHQNRRSGVVKKGKRPGK